MKIKYKIYFRIVGQFDGGSWCIEGFAYKYFLLVDSMHLLTKLFLFGTNLPKFLYQTFSLYIFYHIRSLCVCVRACVRVYVDILCMHSLYYCQCLVNSCCSDQPHDTDNSVR